jgi:exoribonuclease II
MEVDQKHITMIRMHDAKGSDIVIFKDGPNYQLQLASSNNMVNISLGAQDVRKLCQQLVQLDMEENWRAPAVPAPEPKASFFNGASRPFSETMARWFARMANEMNERTTKQ